MQKQTYLSGVDISKLRTGLTVGDAKKYIMSCPNGNKIRVMICDSTAFDQEICYYNTIRLLVDNDTLPVAAMETQVVRDAMKG
jgi:hypothetical protein